MRRVAALVACSVLLLAGCGGSHSAAKSTASGSASAGTALPTVSGSYGDKPALTFPKSGPPTTLQKKVLSQGNGRTVAKGELLVADYLGQVWQGKVFDNSYDRKQPAAFPIGVGQVIPGWDSTLVGVKSGSRILLSVPPSQGYGAQGNPQAGIKGTDTLVFVVDVVASYSKAATGDPHATPVKAPKSGPQVSGPLGQRPKVTIPKGAPQPKKVTTTVLARGHGAPAQPGLLVVQFEAQTWAGKSGGSTWQAGTPFGVSIGDGSQPGVFDSLKGVPLGSRVLLQVPAQQNQPALAVALDLVAQPKPAKAST